MALSISSASTRQWKYDVFLSFRGRETRHGFVSHLYEALESTGRINTFMDEEKLEVGNAISPNLLMAIEESRLAIVVLSPDYASSPWCLDELTKIHQSMEGRDRILPVFYHVDPSHVRHQLGSFAEAFTKHKEKSRQSKEKFDQWRLALKNVADLSGWDTKNFRSEGELVKRIVKFVRNKVLQVPPRSIPIEFKAQPTDDFESTRRARDDLIKALNDDEITAIGVYGTGGVGKTTLVKHVSAQARELGLVNYVIRAVVGQSPESRNIQGTLADQLGLKFEKEETEIGRAARLLERIMGGNKILIVLEDVGERIDLSDIGIPHYNELQRHNSKLILTSGSNSVCSSMQCQARIHLDTLSEEDSWNLFVEKSGKSFQESTELYDVARAVARECGGLPLALITVARALGDKDIEDWKEAAQRLDRLQTVNLEDEGKVYKCIKFSYEYLRSDDAKSFFLLCCLFPEDYDTPIEDLLMYAIGKGLLQDVKTIQEARATANSVIKSLRHYGLLLDGTKEGCVRMHDVVRDVAVLISMYEYRHISMVISGCGRRDWPTIDPHIRYSAISLMMNDIRRLPVELICSELQILLLQNNPGIYKIPETFFQSSNALRVLDISSTNILLPPRSFNILTNLQALFLDYCNKLIDISIFRNLKKLEILSMREFPLRELPKEIGYLTNLRMLDLSGSYKLGIFPYNVMSRLCKLEELYMQCNSGVWGSKIHGGGEETKVDLDEFIGLTHLNVVKLHISDAECLPKTVIHSLSWVNFNICISAELPSRNYSSTPYFSDDHSRTLTLSTTIKSLPDWFINTVTKKAGKLQYLKCEGLNILVEYERGRLHGLKYLAVIGPHKNMEVLMDTITWVPNKPVFENLEELHLLGVSYLKALCLGELPPGSLFNLKSLKLEYCHDMVSAMLPSNLLKSIQNLEKLHCEDMNGMEYVFGYEGLEPEDIILTKLREMILWDVEKLISIWNCPAPNAVFRNLKSMAVSGCKKLKSLFTYDVAECLFHLEDLSVTQCPSLDRVIEPSKEAVNKKIVFPELKILALSYLPHLTRFCSTESATIECPSLEHLHVQDCPHFTTSISDFHSWKQFQVNDLRHLRTSNDMVNIDLAGQHTMDILESLPQNIRKRVEVIRDFQRQHDELQTKFFKERAALEAKYQKLYQPLFKKRCMIVNGVVEADGVTTEAAANQEDKAAKERGVCDFWLNALKNNDVLANQITERDERALKYLEDIKWFRIRNPKGFKLEFYFDTNPFFKNSTLTKTYHMIGEDEPQKAVGTEIEWYQAKCLTQRTLKEKSKKGSKNSKPLTRTESCESFFNFFSPPQIPEDDADVDEDVAEELKNLKKQDYDIGSIIRYKIIPHAYSWFTGEAF